MHTKHAIVLIIILITLFISSALIVTDRIININNDFREEMLKSNQLTLDSIQSERKANLDSIKLYRTELELLRSEQTRIRNEIKKKYNNERIRIQNGSNDYLRSYINDSLLPN